MSRSLSVRGLTEGAILAALVALFTLAARYVPLLGIVSAFVSPLPLTVLVVRQGLRTGVLASVVAAVIAGMIGGPLTGLGIVLTFAPLGLAFGAVIRRGGSAARILLAGTVVAAVSLLLNLGITLAISGMNPYAVMIQSMEQGQEQALRFYQRLGLDVGGMQQVAAMRQVLAVMPRLIPLLVVLGAVSTAYFNFEITRFVLRRFGYAVPALPPMSSWRAPVLFLWMLPLGIALGWVAQSAPAPFDLPPRTIRMLPPGDVAAALYAPGSRYPLLESAALNFSFLAQMLYLLLGLVAAWVLMERYRAPRWMRWMAISVAFTSPPVAMAVFFLGVADAAFDLRTRWRAPQAVEVST